MSLKGICGIWLSHIIMIFHISGLGVKNLWFDPTMVVQNRQTANRLKNTGINIWLQSKVYLVSGNYGQVKAVAYIYPFYISDMVKFESLAWGKQQVRNINNMGSQLHDHLYVLTTRLVLITFFILGCLLINSYFCACPFDVSFVT